MLARALRRAWHAPMSVIHVVRTSRDAEEERARIEQALAEVHLPDLGTLIIDAADDPMERLLQRANEQDVTIVGADPRRSLAESIFGGCAERITGQAESPVLVVRAKTAKARG